MVNNLIDAIVKFGRNGDTELRNVDNQLSHVNPNEAYLIDNYGQLGEQTTQALGSGTINPYTGMPEYWSRAGGFTTDWTEAYNAYQNYEEGGLFNAAEGVADPDAGTAAGGLFAAWRPLEGSWGIFGETDAAVKRRRAAQKKQTIQRSFDENIGDFKDMNFANMSEAERNREIRDLMGTGISDAQLEKYYDTYDYEKESDVRKTGAEEIGMVGERAQGDLLSMAMQKAGGAGRGGFASTGNPMLDRQRQNIFKGIGLEQEQTYQGMLDTVGDLEDSYNQSLIEAAFKHSGALLE